MSRWGPFKVGTDDFYKQTLADHGLALNDLVTYVNVKDSTGGIIFRIVEDVRPVRPHTTVRTVVKKRNEYKRDDGKSTWIVGGDNGRYVTVEREEKEYGAWDESGKKIMVAATQGYVRIKPVFDFFATSKGKNPKGQGNTIIIEYSRLKDWLRKVDLLTLGSKYVELGNIIHGVARKEGMGDDGQG